ncbi:hypothetical protein [Romboutsia maritimum]|uniref:hypothetical protein n=1 Tax=Romboutsia maritimum TaxID=2020948 RepID=UPI001FB11E30|nr:hypothetical protein [Romboutsia maritimum]
MPKVTGDSYYLPINEGKYIPSRYKYFKKFLNNTSYNTLESFSMQFFTVNKGTKSITYVSIRKKI